MIRSKSSECGVHYIPKEMKSCLFLLLTEETQWA